MIQFEKEQESLQLNMAPMIDMVFLLIIFFLTATTFTEREREQDVLLPKNKNSGSLSRDFDGNIIVNVLESGNLRVFGETQTPESLVALIRDRKERSLVPLKVQVRGDRRTPYGNVTRALQAIERAGVPRPYLVTKTVELEN
ncbi:MAG: biopolymer transporter ExbD [Planctomycetota bacterium]